MNRERAKELLPIIQAFAEGKEIQCKQWRAWYGVDDASFNDTAEYRIKPEPREFWVVVKANGKMEVAEETEFIMYAGIEAIKVREVLE